MVMVFCIGDNYTFNFRAITHMGGCPIILYTGRMVSMISKQYHVSVDFRLDGKYSTKTQETLDAEIDGIGWTNDMKDIEIFYGNPACDPYIYAWCEHIDDAKAFEAQIKSWVKSLGWEVLC
jgi:hypothetical protein